MNPRIKDYMSIKWLHKELIELMLNADDDERIVIDKAIRIYIQMVDKWRKENGGN